MSTVDFLEERVARLERELSELRREVSKNGKDSWLDRIAGTFEGDADFHEIVRLGAEFRRTHRPPHDVY